jgi:AraC-like DNA-binding protein
MRFLRRKELPGLEVLHVENLARESRWFHTAFGVGVIRSWCGDVHYRHRTHAVGPGAGFCAEPGELMSLPRSVRKGDFSAFMFEEDDLRGLLPDDRRHPAGLTFVSTVQRLSPALLCEFEALSRALDSHASAMSLQTRLVQTVAAISAELMGQSPSPGMLRGEPVRSAERIRECIHESGAALDLTTLARETGMSRYQVLRTFKRHYGAPPHAYQLSVRLARAKSLVMRGHALVDAATECGFADQSHLTRLFRRHYGVTPGVYARVDAVRRPDCNNVQDAAVGGL